MDPSDSLLRPGETADRILGGAVRVIQSRRGYRFALDAPLLALAARDVPAWLPGHELPVAHAVELGAGAGVVGLLLARLDVAQRVTLVEIQGRLADQARRSVVLNSLEGRVRVYEGDLRSYAPPPGAPADLVVANPPFHKANSGKPSPDPEKAAAHHELHGTLADVLVAAARILRPQGLCITILPAQRAEEACTASRTAGFMPAARRFVHPMPGRPPNRVIDVWARGAGNAAAPTLPPWIVFERPGVYAPAMAAMLENRVER